jgi:hypothetical protein
MWRKLMSARHTTKTLAARDEIALAPTARACDTQNFEFPTGIFAAMITMFVGFMVVLSAAFTGHMGVSFAAIFAFVAAFFAIPIMMARMAPANSRAMSWSEFLDRGIDTESGRSSAGSALTLLLTLPFLILCFAFGIAILWMAI